MITTTILGGQLPAATLLVGAAALLFSGAGFWKSLRLSRISYGFSIAAMAMVLLAAGVAGASPVTLVEACLLALFGLRLGIFLSMRESRPSFRAYRESEGEQPGSEDLFRRLVVWLAAAALFTALFIPLLSRFALEALGFVDPLPALGHAGIAVTALGIIIEAMADAQKARAKKAAPESYCASGLFKVVRCPSYFGELLVWTGNLLAGAAMIRGHVAWILAGAAYLAIVYFMLSAARHLEIGQEARYGSDQAFRTYTRSVPLLLPFIPLYSLKKNRFII